MQARQSIHLVLRFTVFALAMSVGAGEVSAAQPDAYQGAWVTDMNTCSKVFTTKNGKVTFAKHLGDALPGIIIEGKRIHGATASCSVASSKQNGDATTFLLNCQSQIMFGTMTVTVRMKDPDTLVRIDPDFAEVETTYHRCK
jgi:hypothetical protein